jgi:hypothetical protein
VNREGLGKGSVRGLRFYHCYRGSTGVGTGSTYYRKEKGWIQYGSWLDSPRTPGVGEVSGGRCLDQIQRYLATYVDFAKRI